MSHWHLNQAARIIDAGGVIAYPTEAVYGLGCHPEYFPAVQKILELKHRSMLKGLILVAANTNQLAPYVDFSAAKNMDQVQQSWPGPVTWLLPASPLVPIWIKGVHSKVAVRVSAHPIVQQLCTATGVLVSTSANPGQYPPAKTAFRVRKYFGDSLDYILQGGVDERAQPSMIKDAESGAVIRK